ncbi:MAG: DUF4340 domain-containing protein, partial [Oscillospiraceae bacterium]|nr:DUF4340 domain-containing protein [Oscillospiraceae bacterium]
RRLAIIICLCIMAAFFTGYYFLSRANRREADSQKKIKLCELSAEDVFEIHYERGSMSYSFRREKGSGLWTYLEDPDFPLDPRYIDSMTHRLADVTSTLRVGDMNEEHFVNLGFQDPSLYVTVTSYGGDEYEYTVGSYNDLISRYYLLTGDSEQIHVVEQGFVNVFMPGLYDMIIMDTPPSFFTSAITGFEITAKGRTTRFEYCENGRPEQYSNAVTWFISNDEVADYPAGTNYVINLLAYTGAGMELDACVLYGAKKEDLAKYGLDDPITVSVDYLDGTVRRNVRYYIGDKAEEQYYMMYDGSDKVYLISSEIAKNITRTDLEAFRSSAVTLVKLETVNKLTVSSPGERYVITVEKGTPSGIELYYVNGVEVSVRKVRDFYFTFYHLDEEVVLPQAAEIKEAPFVSIEFERNTADFSYMKLEFIPYDANFYLVSFNGRSDQLVGLRKVEAILNSVRELAA